MPNIQICNPLDHLEWDHLLMTAPHASFFHSSSWARVLRDSYGYSPVYLTVLSNGSLSALIPVMEVNSFLTGLRGVSLPFSDYCDPILSQSDYFSDLFDAILQYGKQSGWKSLELRGGSAFLHSVAPSTVFYGHTLKLTSDENELFLALHESNRRNIKKAISSDIELRVSNSSPQYIKEFYSLNCLTRRRHGLPPQPYGFFKNIYEHVISKNGGIVILAMYHNRCIAGAVFFQYGKSLLYKYGASNANYFHLKPNNLVIWEGIKWGCKQGLVSLSFGRTAPEDTGLRRFKSSWNAREYKIFYYKYDLRSNAFVSNHGLSSRFWPKTMENLPIPILRFLGSILYRHFG